jgi:hypothetical protein
VTARYSGDPAFASGASAARTLAVAPEPSSVTLTSSANPALVSAPVAFKAVAIPQTASDPVTGTITFFDGSLQLGKAVPINDGAASFETSSLALGTHKITAIYSGDSNVLAATSASLDQSIVHYTGDFSIGVSPSKAAVYTGEATKFKIEITPKNGFNYPVDLSCGNLPPEVTCSFSPTRIYGGKGHAILVLQTAAPQKTSAKTMGIGAGAMLAAVFGIFVLPRRRAFIWPTIALLGFLGFFGCGGDPTLGGGTPPGTYTIIVTVKTSASGPQLQHSADLSLTVKSLF